MNYSNSPPLSKCKTKIGKNTIIKDNVNLRQLYSNYDGTEGLLMILLPTAYVVRGKVMFWPMSVHGGGYPTWPGGGGVPQPGPAGGYPTWPGATPGQVQMGGTPARSDRGVPQPGGGGTPGYPPAVVPQGTPQQWYPGYPPGGVPPARGVPPSTGQQMEYLIRRSRYASCVHAGGLSCYKVNLP